MKNKINVKEILKNCQHGMELDCTMFIHPVTFDKVIDDVFYQKRPIFIKTHNGSIMTLTEYGTYTDTIDEAKCVIFPKGKTTWEGFAPPCQFKDGDILYTRCGYKEEYIFIFENITKNIYVNSYLHIKGDDLRIMKVGLTTYDDKCLRLATKEEKQKLFDVIKSNGYKWNAETKTLEKLVEPKFKVGDVIIDKDAYKVRITEVNIEDECYGYESMIAKGISGIDFKEQDDWELVPNKFDISTLKPFDKVLVRSTNDDIWRPAIYGFTDSNKYYVVGGIRWNYCIPYEMHEHLLGTTNDCDEFYKTWQK